jgi:hypothetical protein
MRFSPNSVIWFWLAALVLAVIVLPAWLAWQLIQWVIGN